jgi:hypothetical protein
MYTKGILHDPKTGFEDANNAFSCLSGRFQYLSKYDLRLRSASGWRHLHALPFVITVVTKNPCPHTILRATMFVK